MRTRITNGATARRGGLDAPSVLWIGATGAPTGRVVVHGVTRITVVALSAVVVIAGCSGGERSDRARTVQGTEAQESSAGAEASSDESQMADPAGEVLSKSDARAALPLVSDLPTGWSTDPDDVAGDDDDDDDSGDVYRPARCGRLFDALDRDDDPDKQLVEVDSSFRKSELGPYLNVSVASFEDEVQQEPFDDLVDALGECPKFSVTDEEGTYSMAAAPLSFPNLGDDTLALRFSARRDGTNFEMDFVAVRSGHNVIGATQIALLGVDTAATEQALRAVVSRIVG